MKQSRFMSMLEAALSTAAGFGISLVAQWFFLPLIGVSISLTQNVTFAVIMTFVSLARQFVLRRVFEALHIRVPMSSFATATLRERVRQQTDEGYSLTDDDGLPPGDLALAGACYAEAAGMPPGRAPIDWPWKDELWKPAGFRKDLVRACALIIAEGEKFDRSSKQKRRSF